MCQYAETFHVYSGCKVRETVKVAEEAPNSEPEPSSFARFLKSFGNLHPVSHQDREGGESADANEVEIDFHTIKETSVWQCEEASRNESLGAIPGKRKCSGDKLVYWQGEDRKNRVENPGLTRERGDCPVCVAVARIIDEKSNPTEIRPYTRAEVQPEPAPEHRSSRKRRRGEGTRRNPIRHGSRSPPVVERRRIVTARRQRPRSDCVMM